MGKVHDALMKHESDKVMAALSGRVVLIKGPNGVEVRVWVAGGDKLQREAFMTHCGSFLTEAFTITWDTKVQLGKFTNSSQFKKAPKYVFMRDGKVTKVI